MNRVRGGFALAILAALVSASTASNALASSYPPGDNMPYLEQQGGKARVHLACLDYQSDDGIQQCGRATTSADPGDCYYVALDENGIPERTRHKVDCMDHLPSSTPTIQAIYSRLISLADQEDATFFDDGRAAVWVLRNTADSPKLTRYDTTGSADVFVNWGGLTFNSNVKAGVEESRVAFVGQFCPGEQVRSLQVLPHDDNHFCGDVHNPHGKFGLLAVDTNSNEPATFRELSGAVEIIYPYASAPVFIGDQVYVGWIKEIGKSSTLALSSIDLHSRRYCEWTLPQRDALNLPIPIDLMRWKGLLLGVTSGDGVLTTFAVDPRAWNVSCGAHGVTVGEVQPIAH